MIMKRIAHILMLFSLVANSTSSFAFDGIGVENLKCEMLTNPQGIDVTKPRFSWQINTNERGVKQTAYQIIVASSLAGLSNHKEHIWNSGKIYSDQSVLVEYNGKPLSSRKQYFWKVKVWTNKGEEEWTQPASFTMGLLQSSDWKAKWIGMDKAFPWDSVTKFARLSARYFRKEINTSKKIEKATVYISGLGLYELYINGQKIGDQVLAPGPTDYSKTILYNSFDVTQNVQQGKNAIATVLGNGRFFTMRQNYKPQKWHNFGFPQMLLQLEIEYADGTKQIITSDASWKMTADGPIRTNNEYDGEEYDATKELTGWNETGFDDSKWLKVQLVKAPGGALKAQMNENMKVMERIQPVSIRQLSSGKYILDMGQNMAGWIKMQVQGKRGDVVKLRFAESLQTDGELYTANLRDAIVTDMYTLKGAEKETWHPAFVYHGFRYVEVTGYPGTPTINDFVGEVVYDDMQTIGSLETSNDIINQIHKNAYWGIRSNYKGMPVDCPQRNERQPWLGDRTMGSYGESFLFDNSRLYAKWLNDIHDAQRPEGNIPDVAPNFWYYYKDNMTWPGAYLTIANMLYQQYGDKRSIVKHYASMKKWMNYMKRKYLKDYIMTKDSYGDWCVPPESPELIHSKDPSRITDPKLIATAYYYYFLNVMQKFALLSNNKEDIKAFADEAIKVKAAFNKKFYNKSTAQYSNNTVTANILVLAFNLVPEAGSERVFKNIADKILIDDNGHISTGVIGTQWLMRWLTKYNRADIAYKLASNTTYPSWGYMVKNGATTIWELWNGNTANPSMNSQNHVMLLGDLLVWMYQDLAGIHSDENGIAFKKVVMKPSFDVDLSYVNASYQSPYGTIKSSWKKENGQISWSISVPGNATAVVYIPAKENVDVKEGSGIASSTEGIRFLKMENGNAVFEIGSGNYSFTASDYKLSTR
jgi:alpha-L-rhamnosidase